MSEALYVESSALLRLLLDQHRPETRQVAACFNRAVRLFTSSLTFIEAERAIIFREERRTISRKEADSARAIIRRIRLTAQVSSIDEVAARAAARFPREHVRSLDAIHLATIIKLGDEGHRFAVLSTDDRVRSNASALGFDVLPE